jgi:predicted nucleic acid-binding protein
MDLVLDANILFSILIKQGKNEDLIFMEELHIFAPEFIFEEFEKYKELILEKTSRNDEEFGGLMNILRKKIKLIPNEDTTPFLDSARKICPDIKDIDYFALALKLKCAIWSNDKELKSKQNIVRIYSTGDLLKLF